MTKSEFYAAHASRQTDREQWEAEQNAKLDPATVARIRAEGAARRAAFRAANPPVEFNALDLLLTD